MTAAEFEDGYDPYRTTVGISQGTQTLAILGFGVAFAVAAVLLAILSSR